MDKHNLIREKLSQIEAELKTLALWQATPPDAESLASQKPFCCDTLSFEQWLQFICLPRLGALLDAGATLPNKMALCPMAEESFKTRNDVGGLINLIADLDELVSNERHQEMYVRRN